MKSAVRYMMLTEDSTAALQQSTITLFREKQSQQIPDSTRGHGLLCFVQSLAIPTKHRQIWCQCSPSGLLAALAQFLIIRREPKELGCTISVFCRTRSDLIQLRLALSIYFLDPFSPCQSRSQENPFGPREAGFCGGSGEEQVTGN